MKNANAKDFVLLRMSGVDSMLGDAPINRLAPPPPATPRPARATPPHGAPEISAAGKKVDATTLDELAKELRAFPSDLAKLATNFVFSDGNPASRVMLIGEAPGAEEDRLGLPFVGAAGQLLDRMIAAIGLDRTKCYICNVSPWRPPGNRTPTPEEIAAFLPFVYRHIELVDPKAVLLLGGTAAKCVLRTNESISRLRGKWRDFRTPGGKDVPILPTFHPSYLLRSPEYKKPAWEDLQEFQRKISA